MATMLVSEPAATWPVDVLALENAVEAAMVAVPGVLSSLAHDVIAMANEEEESPPLVASDIYCKGDLLHTVQIAHIFKDSKTFVDMKVRDSPEQASKAFQKMMQDTGNKPTQDHVRAFVNATFEDGNELDEWVPDDWSESPALLSRISDEKYRDWAAGLNKLWLVLGRKMKKDVKENPNLYSLIYVPHGFVIPGGRFKELYYWDSYWIVQGLLLCDMHQTVKGVIENLLHLVNLLGFVPNGSRVYYEERSQPPLLVAMARAYYDKTKDLQFIQDNIELLEKEFNFWMNNSMIEVEKDGKKYKLARYYFLSNGPRPESYREDYETVSGLNTTAEKESMYWELKSGAATGWDFSSRWFIDADGENGGDLKNLKTTMIVPVDLNAILFGAATSLQYFMTLLGQRHKALGYGTIASELREAVNAVMWNEKDGIWYDYDVLNKKQRPYFYGSNLAPLWTYCYDVNNAKEIAAKVVTYIEHSQLLSYRGGTPASLANTGEQWDFPNCWAPLQAFIIQGLDRTGQEDAQNLAEELARRWLHSNYLGYKQNGGMMFEKYDAENIGRFGGGGEYTVQAGFGWTNGMIFELLAQYSSKGGSDYRPASGSGYPLGGAALGPELSNSLFHAADRVRKELGGYLGNKDAAVPHLAHPQAHPQGHPQEHPQGHPQGHPGEKDVSG